MKTKKNTEKNKFAFEKLTMFKIKNLNTIKGGVAEVPTGQTIDLTIIFGGSSRNCQN